ncbi:hypothetical protein BC937DRAFT_93521, partial [Endogone sp. FLAS-F59071]
MKNKTTTIDENLGEEPSNSTTALSTPPSNSLSTSPSSSLSTSPPKSATPGNYVTQLTTVASFGLDVAALFTNIGFGAAKLGTELGLNIAKQSIGSMAEFFTTSQNGNGEDSTLLMILSSPIGLGFTVATSTLTFAEFLALSGIQWTHNAVDTGLVAAKETVGVLDKFFGSNDT